MHWYLGYFSFFFLWWIFLLVFFFFFFVVEGYGLFFNNVIRKENT